MKRLRLRPTAPRMTLPVQFQLFQFIEVYFSEIVEIG